MSSASAFFVRPGPARPAVDLGLAVVAGLIAFALSCLLVWPDPVAKGFGMDWELMSADPFAFPGQLPQRILTPLLAHVLGFGGAPSYVTFTRLLQVLLLATIWFFARRRGASPLDASLVMLAVAVISPIQMYKLHWVGYCDALTYTLFFWMLLAAERPLLFWSLFFANLLNHELALFLLPWLWFVRRAAGGEVRPDVFGAWLALAAYAAFYLYVRSVAPAQHYNADYFARNPLFPGGTIAVLVVALVHWTVAFGPVLAVLAWFQHTRETEEERPHLWWVLLGIGLIFCIAFDWNRHTNLLVLPLVIASVRFLAAGYRVPFAVLVALGVVLMKVWSPWPSSSWPTDAFTNPDLLVATQVVVPVPGRPKDIGFGTIESVATQWLPRVWPTLWPILVILAAIWLVGWALVRFRPRLTAIRAVRATP